MVYVFEAFGVTSNVYGFAVIPVIEVDELPS